VGEDHPWYRDVIGGGRCPIVDNWWQTETGAIMISPVPGVTTTKPGLGYPSAPWCRSSDRERGRRGRRHGTGIADAATTLAVNAAHAVSRRRAIRQHVLHALWLGLYFVGDAARRDEDGDIWVIGRVDDFVNVSGHRLPTAEVESAIASHETLAEAAVIGQAHDDTGQSVTASETLRRELDGSDELSADLRAHVALRIGKLARPNRIIWTEDLPKTRSGKIMRRLLRDIAEGRELGDVTTLRDPEVIAQLQVKVAELQRIGDE
jgi:acetyl-CoA synthetase